MKAKQILAAVFSLRLLGKKTTPSSIAERLGMGKEDLLDQMEQLQSKGMLTSAQGRVFLTQKGRRALKIVFIGGGFEVIHQGHLYTIQSAKSLGDVLVVSVARDSTIRKRKRRKPIAGEAQRVALLSSLRQVDAAILGVKGDIYQTLEKVKPDVVALGYDQYHIESEIEKQGARRGMKIKVIRLGSPFPHVKTSTLLEET